MFIRNIWHNVFACHTLELSVSVCNLSCELRFVYFYNHFTHVKEKTTKQRWVWSVADSKNSKSIWSEGRIIGVFWWYHGCDISCFLHLRVLVVMPHAHVAPVKAFVFLESRTVFAFSSLHNVWNVGILLYHIDYAHVKSVIHANNLFLSAVFYTLSALLVKF